MTSGTQTTPACEQVALPLNVSPRDVFAALADEPFAQLLDWQAGDGTAYVLCQPDQTFTMARAELDADSAGGAFRRLEAALASWVATHGYVEDQSTTDMPPVAFFGGAAGVFAYELTHDLEHLPHHADDDPAAPVLTVGFYDAVVAFPAGADSALILSPWDTPHTAHKREQLRALIENTRPCANHTLAAAPEPTPTIDAAAYKNAVAQVIEYIHAGDIFQANLAQRFDAQLPASVTPYDLYRRLVGNTPPPFAAHVTLPDRTLVSSSPERLLKVTADGHVRTEPIKGTRPRGATTDDDNRLAQELTNSPKDRAENVMIVDLLRNDLSKVCADHTVTVEELCELRSFTNVHHLVSAVSGTLRADMSAIDCLAACFPGGSITGAPKVRAMEIISELEPHRRGAYCGSIGFVGVNGTMDTSIAIRTLTVTDRHVSYHAGGGIVADSTPQDEYEETIAKASAMRRALTSPAGPDDSGNSGEPDGQRQ